MSSPVYQLLYMSKAVVPMNKEQIARLLTSARRHNQRHGVSGILIYRHELFLQLLEGTPDAVRMTYERIKSDTRHSHFINLMETSVERRLFAGWSMAYSIEMLSEEEAEEIFIDLDREMHSPQIDQKVIMSILEHFVKSPAP